MCLSDVCIHSLCYQYTTELLFSIMITKSNFTQGPMKITLVQRRDRGPHFQDNMFQVLVLLALRGNGRQHLDWFDLCLTGKTPNSQSKYHLFALRLLTVLVAKQTWTSPKSISWLPIDIYIQQTLLSKAFDSFTCRSGELNQRPSDNKIIRRRKEKKPYYQSRCTLPAVRLCGCWLKSAGCGQLSAGVSVDFLE